MLSRHSRAQSRRRERLAGMMPAAKQRDLFSRRWRNAVIQEHSERSFQIQLVSILRWCIRADVTWRHVPNVENRDLRTAQKLKAMGTLAGSADLEFFYRSAETPSADAAGQRCDDAQPSTANDLRLRILFLELKTDKGKL